MDVVVDTVFPLQCKNTVKKQETLPDLDQLFSPQNPEL